MRSALAIGLLWLLTPAAWASALDEALAMVREHHPVLVAERAQLAEQSRQRDWAARVSLSWTERGTEYGGEGGPNAGVHLSIPLFDRKTDLERARARATYTGRMAVIEAAFLAQVKGLGAEAGKVRAAEALRDLYRDRLAYRKQQVEEGLVEADALWPEAEAVQKAEQALTGARDGLEAGLETTAREYGGSAWKPLRALLAAHMNSRK